MSYDAVDFMFRKPFKFKYKGMKMMARPLHDGDVITERTLQSPADLQTGLRLPFATDFNWQPSRCVGESTLEHPDRWYIEVISPFYQGESDSSLTDL